MIVAIRKEPDNSIYIDKNIYNDERFTKEELSQSPYNYNFINVDQHYSDCEGSDFNDDFTFNIEKYNARKRQVKSENRITEIQTRLNELSQDLIQMECGAIFEDEEERIREFQDLHNELRKLLGKEPRVYNLGDVNG